MTETQNTRNVFRNNISKQRIIIFVHEIHGLRVWESRLRNNFQMVHLFLIRFGRPTIFKWENNSLTTDQLLLEHLSHC
jgi:hypothetical protein